MPGLSVLHAIRTRPSLVVRATSLLLAVVMLALVACNRGLPAQPGSYEVQAGSIAWDGEKYFFLWRDAQGNLYRASGDDIKLVQDERTYLEIREKPGFLGLGRATEAILHLREDQPITLYGRDRDGDFTSFWFPFLLGHVTAGGGPPPPLYHYPPRSSFDRGERLEGSITSDRPQPPDYRRLAPAPNTVSGQAGGTGGGVAATSKSSREGDAPPELPAAAVSGQAGGTGSGTAATAKGGFRTGKDSFDAQQRAATTVRSLEADGSGGATGGSKVTPPGQTPAVKALTPRSGSAGPATLKGGGGRSFGSGGVRVRR